MNNLSHWGGSLNRYHHHVGGFLTRQGYWNPSPPSTHNITTLYLIVKHQIGHETPCEPTGNVQPQGNPPLQQQKNDKCTPQNFLNTETTQLHQYTSAPRPSQHVNQIELGRKRRTATPPSETWNARHPNAPTDRKAYITSQARIPARILTENQ